MVYLRLLLNLVHHADLCIPALVHLVDEAGDDLSDVQVGVVGEVQINPAEHLASAVGLPGSTNSVRVITTSGSSAG